MGEAVRSVETRFVTGSRIGALMTVAIGLAALAGWAFDLPRLTSVLPGLVTMKANAAVCFVLLGTALLLVHAAPSASRREAALAKSAVLLIVAFVAAAAALTLAQDLFGLDLGVDQLLFREAAGGAHTTNPGRMSPGTAVAFIVSGASITMLLFDRAFAPYVAQTLASAVGAQALVVLSGYFFDVPALYRVGEFSAMSLNTALALLVLALAILAARAGGGWMREFSRDTISSRFARWLGLAALAAMLALTAFHVHGVHFGWFDRGISQAVHAIAGMVTTLILLWFFVRTANRTELRAAHLGRVRVILGAVNNMIVRARDFRALAEEACRIATGPGGYRLAAIGLLDRKSMRIVPVASAGEPRDLADTVARRLTLAIGAGTREPAAGTVLSATPIAIADIASAADMPMREELARAGLRACAMVPLVAGGEVRGVLTAYAAELPVFDDEEIELLREVASDLAFALDYIEKEQRLNYLALYDALTGLANRTLFLDRLAQHLAGTAQAHGRLALLLLDVSRFRLVNAAIGRGAADSVLREIGARLERAHEPTRLARIAGDQFAAIVPRLAGERDAVRVYEHLAERCFGSPFAAGGQALTLDVRAGIATFPEDGSDPETLYKSAENALLEAKRRGARYAFHNPASDAAAADRLLLESRLRTALANRELRLHYQARVNVRTRKITGAEALMRWQGQDGALVSPAQFIPVLEETRLIHEAGAWAIAQAAADALRLAQDGLHGIRLAVNVSQVQLRERDFAQAAARAAGTRPGPGALELEITESAAMEDVEQTLGTLRELSELGFALAIDDFGTGYSSLAWLAKFPVQSVKIDRTFVGAMLHEELVARVVRTITDLAHGLGMTVVAEGVETEEQAARLAEIGCDEMQGFLVSRPLPYEDFAAFVRRLGAGS